MTASGNSPRRGLPRPASVVERRMSKILREPPSVRLAANVIVTATTLIVVVGGVLMRVLDHSDFNSVWIGMWWVLETVTTVGYGDHVPKEVIGKLLTAAVMLWGVAFLAIATAAITSVFVARAQRERVLSEDDEQESLVAGLGRVDRQLGELSAQTKQLDERLERLSKLLEQTPPAS